MPGQDTRVIDNRSGTTPDGCPKVRDVRDQKTDPKSQVAHELRPWKLRRHNRMDSREKHGVAAADGAAADD
jgi:hypothetical protein